MSPREDQLLLLPQVTSAHPRMNSDSPQNLYQARILLFLAPLPPQSLCHLSLGQDRGFVWASCVPMEPYNVKQIRAQGPVKCLKWAKPRGETRIPFSVKDFSRKILGNLAK